MKNLFILLLLLPLENTLIAQRWNSAFIGKPESRALYASNVAKAIQNAWENELASKNKNEMLLDEIIFGQDSEKKNFQDIEIGKGTTNNIDEIEEVLGIEEKIIDPVKKKKVDATTLTSSENSISKLPIIKKENIQNADDDAIENELLNKGFERPVSNYSYSKNKTTLTIKSEEIEIDTIYDIPEVTAMFPGGTNAMKYFFEKNIVITQNNDQAIKGKVFVRFMIDKFGKLSRVYLVKGLIDICNQEAIRVIKKMPSWIPATQNGKRVNSWQTLPIYFEIE